MVWGLQVAQSRRQISKRQSVAILVAAVSIQVTSPGEVTASFNKIRNKVYKSQQLCPRNMVNVSNLNKAHLELLVVEN